MMTAVSSSWDSRLSQFPGKRFRCSLTFPPGTPATASGAHFSGLRTGIVEDGTFKNPHAEGVALRTIPRAQTLIVQ